MLKLFALLVSHLISSCSAAVAVDACHSLATDLLYPFENERLSFFNTSNIQREESLNREKSWFVVHKIILIKKIILRCGSFQCEMFVCVFLPSPLQSKSTESLDANLFLSSHLVCSVVVIFFHTLLCEGQSAMIC